MEKHSSVTPERNAAGCLTVTSTSWHEIWPTFTKPMSTMACPASTSGYTVYEDLQALRVFARWVSSAMAALIPVKIAVTIAATAVMKAIGSMRRFNQSVVPGSYGAFTSPREQVA